MRNPPWSRDEHILALAFYLQHQPHIPGKDSPEVKRLSDLLNALQQRLGESTSATFRNPAGVYMKLMNFRRFDPSHSGVGLAHGNKDEETVWSLYANKPHELKALAEHIASFSTESSANSETLPELSDDEEEGNEGRLLSRVHRYRERDRNLVKRKKEKFIAQHSRLFCEACGFDFAKTYGEHGRDFIECHHTKPVSELSTNETTKLSELVMLCSNCHRIVHRKKPWLSFSELVQKIQNKQ